MFRYFLTFLTAIPLVLAIAITPKYWGVLTAKHLIGSVLTFYLGWFITIWAIFIELKSRFYTSNNYLNIFKYYVKTVLKFAGILFLLSLIYGVISILIHSILSKVIGTEILDRLSLFIFSLGTVIFLLRMRWIQPIS